MLKAWTRVLIDKDGSITDKSLASQNGDGFSCDLSASGEYLYIGQTYPFNNFSLELGASGNVNGNVALTVQYWSGNSFVDAVDVLDGTVASGGSFAQNGGVQFAPDRDHTWAALSDTSSDSDFPLSAFKLYDLFWIRLSFSQNLSSGTTAKYLRYKFCEHADLAKADPEINNYLEAWTAGKTNWDEQINEGTENIISILKERRLILHPGQILRFDDVSSACKYETLALIYSQLGPSFDLKTKNFRSLAKQHLGDKRFTFDVNRNGAVDAGEQELVIGEGVR